MSQHISSPQTLRGNVILFHGANIAITLAGKSGGHDGCDGGPLQ